MRRKDLIVLIAVGVVVSIVFGFALPGYIQNLVRLGIGSVALIELSGIISYSGSSFNIFSPGSITPSDVKYYVDKALSDPSIKAVVISINSVGGSAAASEEIYQILSKLAENKVVVVYSPEILASGGYYIALPAKKIVVSPHAIVGSVGAVTMIVNVNELLNKLGVNITIVKSGEFKDILSPYRSPTQKELSIIQEIVNKTAQIFVERVKKHRVIMDEDVFKAKIYFGEEAVRVGLADDVGTLDKAIEIAKELAGLPQYAPLIKIEKPKGLLQQLLGLDLKIGKIEISFGGVCSVVNDLSEFVGKPLYLWIPGLE